MGTVPGPAGPGQVPRGPVLVGRGAELATARRPVDAVAAGRGGALLVAGEAGIGKTRLLDEVAGRAAERGLPVLSGRAVQGGRQVAAIDDIRADYTWWVDGPAAGRPVARASVELTAPCACRSAPSAPARCSTPSPGSAAPSEVRRRADDVTSQGAAVPTSSR